MPPASLARKAFCAALLCLPPLGVAVATPQETAKAPEPVTYRKQIRPLWQARCSGCHGATAPYLGDFAENPSQFTSKGIGPRMDTYADLIFYVGWPDTGALMRRLDDGAGSPERKAGNMYRHLGATEDERQANLKLFKAWVGEGAWNLKRWKARGDQPGITKEELEKLQIRY